MVTKLNNDAIFSQFPPYRPYNACRMDDTLNLSVRLGIKSMIVGERERKRKREREKETGIKAGEKDVTSRQKSFKDLYDCPPMKVAKQAYYVSTKSTKEVRKGININKERMGRKQRKKGRTPQPSSTTIHPAQTQIYPLSSNNET